VVGQSRVIQVMRDSI